MTKTLYSSSYHSIVFTEKDMDFVLDEYSTDYKKKRKKYKNTWEDWHLVPTSRPLFNPPQMKTAMVEIPGGDGYIDLSEALTGYPTYGNRTGSIEFAVLNDYRDWADLYSEICNFLHGRVLRAVLEDDTDYFYEGRFTVNSWKSNNNGTWSNITIDYDVKPYKLNMLKSNDSFEWDEFDFETGIITDGIFAFSLDYSAKVLKPGTQPSPEDLDKKIEYGTIVKTGTTNGIKWRIIEKDFTGYIGRKPVCPKFLLTYFGTEENIYNVPIWYYVPDIYGNNWVSNTLKPNVGNMFNTIELTECTLIEKSDLSVVKMRFKEFENKSCDLEIEFRGGEL